MKNYNNILMTNVKICKEIYDSILTIVYLHKHAEDDCPLSKFIKYLDDAKGTGRIDFEEEIKIIENTQREKVLGFFIKLQEIYSFITADYLNIRNQCCSYLNFWLDEKKKSKEKQELDINDEGWKIVENLWDRVKGNNSFSCKRKSQKISMDYKKTCYDFMVYCVNRDKLKQKCEQDDKDGLKKQYCDNFNDYINHYYKHFTDNVTCLKGSKNDIYFNWRFSDLCTLHDMAKTFPKYESSSQSIEDDKTRQQIKKCQSHEEIKTTNCYMLDGVPVTLEELPTIDVIPLKYGVYAGSSFIGFFSLGLYLYKVTKLLY
ncbi:hypothetical protein PVIIG_05803 [Plasmodium vivax India VII]|uniref:Uncharacterized protein n=1 Tax=Plasmodium vivax India VII TaxID=1077284 RepID=A0A0J9S4H0_PLAVI|nr:hypothetical protein PVIIG_05803 [Plasmodium vivax India VII]